MRFPSGLNVADVTLKEWHLGVAGGAWAAVSHRHASPALEVVRTCKPSGLKVADITASPLLPGAG